MLAKFNKNAGNQWITSPDNAALTIPNSDFVIGFILHLDGDQTNSKAEYILSTGPFGVAGSLQLAYRTAASSANPGRVVAYHGTKTTIRGQSSASVTSGTHLFALARIGTGLYIKQCTVLSVEPTDGAAILTTGAGNLSAALDGAGLAFGNRQDLPADRLLDQSIGRLFMYEGQLSDFELAQLAFGKEITALGKNPTWYLRLNDADDIVDHGLAGLTFTKSGAVATSSAQPGFGYVPPGVAPAINGDPVINGTPQVGVEIGYTPAPTTGTPTPTRKQQWYVDTVAVTGETGATFTPESVEEAKALAVEQIAESTSGTAKKLSAAKVIAAAPGNGIDGNELPAERIYQRVNGTASIPVSGTYTGAAPTAVEYQLYAELDDTVAQPWQAVVNLSVNTTAKTWAGAITQGKTAAMCRVRYRANNGAMSPIKSNLFGVNDLGVFLGSSSSERPFLSSSGTGFTPSSNVRKFDAAWSRFGTVGSAIPFANSVSEQSGGPIGLLDCGEGGTLLSDWLNTSGPQWTALKDAITAVGGKIAFAYIAIGSNDAATSAVTSRQAHEANLRQLIANLRDFTGQPTLRVVLIGMNRRTNHTIDSGVYAQQANYVRMAETALGDDLTANVLYVPTHDLLMNVSDGTHLTSSAAGFPAAATRAAYIAGKVMYGDGAYPRGPRFSSAVYSGADITFTLQHRNGNDFALPTAPGLTVTDNSGAATAVSVTKLNALSFRVTYDRILVNPKSPYLAGGAPAVNTMILDSGGAVSLPVPVDTELTPTQAEGDASAPTLPGPLSVTNITQTSATLSWPQGSDDIGVAGYEYRMNPSGAFTDAGLGRTVIVSTLTAGTQYQPQAQAYDASGKRSATVTATAFTTLTTPDTVKPVMSGALTITPGLGGGTVSWAAASDNVSVARYERQIDGGAWVSTGAARTASFSGLSLTAHPVAVRAVDPSENYSDPLTGTLTPLDNSMPIPLDYAPSESRTLIVKNSSTAPFAAKIPGYWNVTSNPKVPYGLKDPSDVIDIPMQWAEVLSDIGNVGIAQATIVAADGLTKVAEDVRDGSLQVGFFAAGAPGRYSVTYHIKTGGTPAREFERTFQFLIEER